MPRRLPQLHHAALRHRLQHLAHLRPVDQLAPRTPPQSIHQLLAGAGHRTPRTRVPAAGLLFATRRNTTRPAAKTCPAAPAASSASTACARTASTCSTSPAAKPSAAAARRGSIAEINQMLSQPAADAARGHDRPRSDAPNRLQLRPATTLRRYPALAVRRHGRLLRSPRPLEHPRLARHRPRELPATRNVPQEPRQLATTTRSKTCSATPNSSATPTPPSTPTPTPGPSTITSSSTSRKPTPSI